MCAFFLAFLAIFSKVFLVLNPQQKLGWFAEYAPHLVYSAKQLLIDEVLILSIFYILF